jgi:hypothetical protein
MNPQRLDGRNRYGNDDDQQVDQPNRCDGANVQFCGS